MLHHHLWWTSIAPAEQELTMFSVLSKLVDFVLGTVLEPDNDKTEHLQESGLQTLVRDQDQQDVLLTSIVDEKEKSAQASVVHFVGKITQLFSGHGLIDGEVYFSDDDVKTKTNAPLQLGDKVSVAARQQFEDGGWIAESVSVVESTWEEEMEEESVIPTGEVGKVTSFSSKDGEGFINKNISFNIAVCQEGFSPLVGDWVTVELDTNVDDSENNEQTTEAKVDEWDDYAPKPKDPVSYAASVAPLREWCFEGKITASMPDHGYIDGEVYFTPRVCMNGYRPRKWDVVKVGAIESTQGKCNWRAVYVVPTSRDSSAFKTRNHNRLQAASQGRGFLVSGQRPIMPNRQHKMSIPNRLPNYPVPEQLRKTVLDQDELTAFFPCLSQRLTKENYILKMDTVLHLEEVQMEIDILQYSLHRVCLQKTSEYLSLEVPGLAEGRPSLLIGDAVILSSPVDPDQPQYEGIVHEIQRESVLLKFNSDFHGSYRGEDYNVAFTFNRTPFRRCHQAVHLALTTLGEEVLFPKEVNLKHPLLDLTDRNHNSGRASRPSRTSPSMPPGGETAQHYIPGISHAVQDAVKFYNASLNDRQKAAVIHVLLGQARPLPYVIFGPPGTGKTMTVVEAILQVLTRIPGSRLIACTPSNSAADLLAERLHDSGVIKASDMVRLNAFNRSQENIPKSILGYCSTGEKLDVLSRYRIIVATCNTAGLLYTVGLRSGHFTHAFVDEAGQATEPECLIPAGLIAGADGQIILAGDPRQLGPVLMSPFAKMYGLELSFLERLMDRLPYQYDSRQFQEHGGFQPSLVTMLVNNYRSHPSILSLPSSLFYFNQLQEFASPHLTHCLVRWALLPNPQLPVVFHGVRSEDVREGDSPSWFNPGETVQVVRYLQGLLSNTPPVAPDNIGVITPYRKQVEKIRMMTERLGIPRVKIGSVEEFQGQERQAIIISTVRSNERLVRSDVRHVLGFLSNPKRFNVSITRAQALLVVIGNPHVLIRDECWGQFVTMCVQQDCYTGCDLPESLTSSSAPPTSDTTTPDDVIAS